MPTRSSPILLVLGVAVLVVTWAAALPADISAVEVDGFRVFNDLPDWIRYPGWVVMQLGSLAAILIVAVACFSLFRDWELGARVGAAGLAAWALAKLGKVIVERGRPETLLDGVDLNIGMDWSGFGFPSGHSAVAMAIAVGVAGALPPRFRRWVWAGAIATGLLRIYAGAHFPLDVLGGWGLGLTVGVSVELGWARLRSWGGRPLLRSAS